MSSPFLSGGGSSGSATVLLTSGSVDAKFASTTVENLLPNYPVKTDANRVLSSGQIQLSDCNFSPLVNPFVGTFSTTNLTVTALSTAGYLKNSNLGVVSTSSAIPQSDVTSLTTDLGLKAPLASPVFTGTVTIPTVVVSGFNTSGYVRTSNAGLLSSASAIPQSDVTSLTTDLGLKASLASPVFTGIVTTPDLTISTFGTAGYMRNSAAGVVSSLATIPINDVAAGYLRVTGSTPMTGNLNMNGQSITTCLAITSSSVSASNIYVTNSVDLQGNTIINGSSIGTTNLTVTSLNVAGYVKNNTSGQLSTATTVPADDVGPGFLKVDGTAPMTGSLNMNSQSITNVRSISQLYTTNSKLLTSNATGNIEETPISQSLVDMRFGTLIQQPGSFITAPNSITYLPSVGAYGRVIGQFGYSDNAGASYSSVSGLISFNWILSQPNAAGLLVALPAAIGTAECSTSIDGITWTSNIISTPLMSRFQIPCVNGNFIGHNNSNFYYSTTGLSWTVSTAFSGTMGCICPVGGPNLIAVSTTDTYSSTDNGVTWTVIATAVMPIITRYAYFNNTLILASNTTNAHYYQSSPYNATWTSGTIGVAGIIACLAVDTKRSSFVATTVFGGQVQIWTSNTASGPFLAGPTSSAGFASSQGVLFVHPTTNDGIVVASTSGPPTYAFLAKRPTTTIFDGGLRTKNLAIDVSDNIISSSSGGINIQPLSGQAFTVTSTGGGIASITTINQPITINSGTASTNITGVLTAGTAKCVIVLNGAGQLISFSADVNRAVPLLVSSALANQFSVNLSTGAITYTGVQTTWFNVNFVWTATPSANAGNAAYISFAPNSTMTRSLMTTNAMNAAGAVGGTYSNSVLMATNAVLQLNMLCSLTAQNLTFTGYQLTIQSMLA